MSDTAKYPEPNFLPARHVRIAWNHGDVFIHRVWTTRNGKWEDGTELVRNIVRSRRKDDDTIPFADYKQENLLFHRAGLTKTQVRKKNRKDRKRNREIDATTENRVATKLRFNKSPQNNDMDQEEIRANINGETA